ncbi:MAG: hypothetical protein LAO09_22150 [Acidobacteriia bacterium]|nr:hypothetical protein [Terriglobia bacterium]
MPENTPTPPTPTPVSPTAEPPRAQTDFRIGEEFGTAKKNLPPVKILIIGVVAILIAWAIAAFLQRPRTSASGSIDEVVSVEIPGQNAVMVAINVSFQNGGTKPFWIHTIKSELQTASGSFTDDAASPVDFGRYYQAFPALRQYAAAPLQVEAKIEPGAQIKGTIVVSFPVTPEAFANRKALAVKIQPYDQPVPLVLTK